MITRRPAGPCPIWAAALLLAVAGLALPGAAGAAPAPDATPARIAQTDPELRPVSVESEDDTANCSRARRRLWVEGEGWIVRRVTTCR